MIDTVVMMLEMGKFAILEPSKFSPPADLAKDRIRLGKNGNYKFIRNPLKAEKETNYYPRLTLNQQCFVNGSHITKLKIEFSAPKLLFKNNFDELKDNDFDLVIDSLFARLNEMGVKTKKEFLEQAPEAKNHKFVVNLPVDKRTLKKSRSKRRRKK